MTPKRYRATVEFEVAASDPDDAIWECYVAAVGRMVMKGTEPNCLLDRLGPYTVTVTEIGATAKREVGR